MKVLVNKTPSSTAAPLLAKIAPRKETPAATAPGKVTPSEVLRREGSSRHWDKWCPSRSPCGTSVQKHKEEAGPVAVTTTEAQVSEVPNSWRSSSPSSGNPNAKRSRPRSESKS
ncbi:hypothetical protein B296_00031402 [Ensete ventricosum]|uniref:Uncharacterized protein n=1 Tax=Ensete ventricosum TaxID=4639 RepID=A0A426XCN7_ENSVE|nr:hypothetical protein B296_00031402 [Ensete ventricosum]